MIPPMSQPESPAEFTLKAVVTGVVLGIVFGAANAYLGLRVGMTVSASIPAAVMTVAAFRLFRSPGTILEANLSQTVASASTSLATGTIFTIPALFLWGMAPPYLQVVALAFLGGLLGLSAMIPLRRLLIVQAHDELPYPEGTACAEVLRATSREKDGVASGSVWIFRGMAVGASVKVLISLVYLVPGELHAALPVLPKAELALEVAPALLGVGYILGYRQSAVCVAGALISAVTLTPLIAWLGAGLQAPLYPETEKLVSQMTAGDIWARYVRYIGAGAVATAGILTVLRGLPTMASAFLAVARGLRRDASGSRAARSSAPTATCRPAFVFGGVATVVLVAGLVPGVFAGNMAPVQRAVLAAGVGVFGVLFVTVAARIVGIVGVSSQPTSGIALVTLLGTASIFAAAGWVDAGARAAVLTVGTIVAIAASKAGDISQDLKTGWLVGATPARQQLGQLIGAAFACWAVAATVLLLGKAYTFGSPAAGRAPGDAHEDDHRGRAGRRAAVGPRPHRRGPLDRRDALRRLGPRLRDRRLSPARHDGSPVRRRLRALPGREGADEAAGGGGRPGCSRRVGPGGRRRPRRGGRGRARGRRPGPEDARRRASAASPERRPR